MPRAAEVEGDHLNNVRVAHGVLNLHLFPNSGRHTEGRMVEVPWYYTILSPLVFAKPQLGTYYQVHKFQPIIVEDPGETKVCETGTTKPRRIGFSRNVYPCY